MSDDELGDRPEPTTEPPERFPGGADSVADEEKYGEIPDEPVIPDLPTEDNPAVNDAAPEEVRHPEETDEPSSDGASDPEEESQA